ncbi:MAG: TraB/GumN family protein [Ectothiorhodospiraceae bacterium]|nr:TraB/GumN family protein [Ectothiorhodospiraceae bacterium]
MAEDTDIQQKTSEEPMATVMIGESRITLLGTAHVSRTSAEKVKELIETGDYDAVAVELCPSRYNSIVNPDALAKMDLFQVIREGKASMVAASLALGAFQQKAAEQMGIQPGAEMREAIDCAKVAKLPVLLVDREVGTTLKRIYRNVPWWRRMNLITGLIASVVSSEKVSEEEIERLKEGDILESTFSQFAEQEQDLFLPLIGERDHYMVARLQQEVAKHPHENILVVIGAGHLAGMVKRFAEVAGGEISNGNVNGNVKDNVKDNTKTNAQDTSKTLEQDYGADEVVSRLDTIPKGAQWLKYFPWLIVALVFVGFGIGFSRSPEMGWDLVMDWVLINGGLAALGALLAAAHPLTVVGAFLAAPLTSLNPTIGAGMVTAGIEVYFRRPKVGDFSKLRNDTTTIRGWWRNRVTRTLLVFMFSTIGSAIGTYVAGFRIFGKLTG